MVAIPALLDSGQDLRTIFERITAESCPRTYNFHMHTVCSDGRLQPEDLIQQAIALGLKGLAITDHHTVGGCRAAQSWLASQARLSPSQSLPTLWSGVEITAKLLEAEVHILGYGFDPQHSALHPYLQGHAVEGGAAQAAQVIGALHQAGGLAVLAHPVRYRLPPEALIPAAAKLSIDGIETYYCYHNPAVWHPSPTQTSRVKHLGTLHSLFHTCGTDTHGLNLLQRL